LGDHQRFLTPQAPSPDDDLRGSKPVTPIEFGQPLLSQSGDSETTHVPPGSVSRRPPHPKSRLPTGHPLVDLPQASTPPSGSGIGPERALERRHPDPPRATARKPSLSPRSLRAPTQTRQAERDRAGASIGSDQTPPSRTARKLHPPRSFPASAHPNTPSGAGSGRSEHWKRSNPSLAHSAKAPSSPELPCERPPKHAKRSGIGPERALEAIKPLPRAQRESPSSPELPQRAQDRSRGAPPFDGTLSYSSLHP
jgi:hypothetical protein